MESRALLTLPYEDFLGFSNIGKRTYIYIYIYTYICTYIIIYIYIYIFIHIFFHIDIVAFADTFFFTQESIYKSRDIKYFLR